MGETQHAYATRDVETGAQDKVLSFEPFSKKDPGEVENRLLDSSKSEGQSGSHNGTDLVSNKEKEPHSQREAVIRPQKAGKIDFKSLNNRPRFPGAGPWGAAKGNPLSPPGRSRARDKSSRRAGRSERGHQQLYRLTISNARPNPTIGIAYPQQKITPPKKVEADRGPVLGSYRFHVPSLPERDLKLPEEELSFVRCFSEAPTSHISSNYTSQATTACPNHGSKIQPLVSVLPKNPGTKGQLPYLEFQASGSNLWPSPEKGYPGANNGLPKPSPHCLGPLSFQYPFSPLPSSASDPFQGEADPQDYVDNILLATSQASHGAFAFHSSSRDWKEEVLDNGSYDNVESRTYGLTPPPAPFHLPQTPGHLPCYKGRNGPSTDHNGAISPSGAIDQVPSTFQENQAVFPPSLHASSTPKAVVKRHSSLSKDGVASQRILDVGSSLRRNGLPVTLPQVHFQNKAFNEASSLVPFEKSLPSSIQAHPRLLQAWEGGKKTYSPMEPSSAGCPSPEGSQISFGYHSGLGKKAWQHLPLTCGVPGQNRLELSRKLASQKPLFPLSTSEWEGSKKLPQSPTSYPSKALVAEDLSPQSCSSASSICFEGSTEVETSKSKTFFLSVSPARPPIPSHHPPSPSLGLPPSTLTPSPKGSPLPSPTPNLNSSCSSPSLTSSSPPGHSFEDEAALAASTFFHHQGHHPKDGSKTFQASELLGASSVPYQMASPIKAFHQELLYKGVSVDSHFPKCNVETSKRSPEGFESELPPPPYPYSSSRHFLASSLSSTSLDQLDVFLTCKQCDQNFSNLSSFLEHRQFCGSHVVLQGQAKDSSRGAEVKKQHHASPESAKHTQTSLGVLLPPDPHLQLLALNKTMDFLVDIEGKGESKDDPLKLNQLNGFPGNFLPLNTSDLEIDDAKLDSLITEALNGLGYQSDNPEIDSSFIDVFADEDLVSVKATNAGGTPFKAKENLTLGKKAKPQGSQTMSDLRQTKNLPCASPRNELKPDGTHSFAESTTLSKKEVKKRKLRSGSWSKELIHKIVQQKNKFHKLHSQNSKAVSLSLLTNRLLPEAKDNKFCEYEYMSESDEERVEYAKRHCRRKLGSRFSRRLRSSLNRRNQGRGGREKGTDPIWRYGPRRGQEEPKRLANKELERTDGPVARVRRRSSRSSTSSCQSLSMSSETSNSPQSTERGDSDTEKETEQRKQLLQISRCVGPLNIPENETIRRSHSIGSDFPGTPSTVDPVQTQPVDNQKFQTDNPSIPQDTALNQDEGVLQSREKPHHPEATAGKGPTVALSPEGSDQCHGAFCCDIEKPRVMSKDADGAGGHHCPRYAANKGGLLKNPVEELTGSPSVGKHSIPSEKSTSYEQMDLKDLKNQQELIMPISCFSDNPGSREISGKGVNTFLDAANAFYDCKELSHSYETPSLFSGPAAIEPSPNENAYLCQGDFDVPSFKEKHDGILPCESDNTQTDNGDNPHFDMLTFSKEVDGEVVFKSTTQEKAGNPLQQLQLFVARTVKNNEEELVSSSLPAQHPVAHLPSCQSLPPEPEEELRDQEQNEEVASSPVLGNKRDTLFKKTEKLAEFPNKLLSEPEKETEHFDEWASDVSKDSASLNPAQCANVVQQQHLKVECLEVNSRAMQADGISLESGDLSPLSNSEVASVLRRERTQQSQVTGLAEGDQEEKTLAFRDCRESPLSPGSSEKKMPQGALSAVLQVHVGSCTSWNSGDEELGAAKVHQVEESEDQLQHLQLNMSLTPIYCPENQTEDAHLLQGNDLSSANSSGSTEGHELEEQVSYYAEASQAGLSLDVGFADQKKVLKTRNATGSDFGGIQSEESTGQVAFLAHGFPSIAEKSEVPQQSPPGEKECTEALPFFPSCDAISHLSPDMPGALVEDLNHDLLKPQKKVPLGCSSSLCSSKSEVPPVHCNTTGITNDHSLTTVTEEPGNGPEEQIQVCWPLLPQQSLTNELENTVEKMPSAQRTAGPLLPQNVGGHREEGEELGQEEHSQERWPSGSVKEGQDELNQKPSKKSFSEEMNGTSQNSPLLYLTSPNTFSPSCPPGTASETGSPKPTSEKALDALCFATPEPWKREELQPQNGESAVDPAVKPDLPSLFDDDSTFSQLFPRNDEFARRKCTRVYGKRSKKPKAVSEIIAKPEGTPDPFTIRMASDLGENSSFCVTREDPCEYDTISVDDALMLNMCHGSKAMSGDVNSRPTKETAQQLDTGQKEEVKDLKNSSVFLCKESPVGSLPCFKSWNNLEKATENNSSEGPLHNSSVQLPYGHSGAEDNPELPDLKEKSYSTKEKTLSAFPTIDMEMLNMKFEVSDVCFGTTGEDQLSPTKHDEGTLGFKRTSLLQAKPVKRKLEEGKTGKTRNDLNLKNKDKQYKCKVCFQWFLTLGELDFHKLSHNPSPPPTCYMCVQRKFSSREQLRDHLKEKHAKNKAGLWACGMCLKEISDVWMYNEHLREHATQFARKGQAQKSVLGLAFSEEDAAVTHFLNSIICRKPSKFSKQAEGGNGAPAGSEIKGPKEFSGQETVVQKDLPEIPFRIRPPTASLKVPAVPSPDPAPKVEGAQKSVPIHPECKDPSRDCHHCGKQFPKPFKLQRHLVVHSLQKIFLCHKCPMFYQETKELRSHLSQEHEIAEEADIKHTTLYACELCADVMHVIKKSFICSTCNYTFSKKEQYDRHMEKHLVGSKKTFRFRGVMRPGPFAKYGEKGIKEETRVRAEAPAVKKKKVSHHNNSPELALPVHLDGAQGSQEGSQSLLSAVEALSTATSLATSPSAQPPKETEGLKRDFSSSLAERGTSPLHYLLPSLPLEPQDDPGSPEHITALSPETWAHAESPGDNPTLLLNSPNALSSDLASVSSKKTTAAHEKLSLAYLSEKHNDEHNIPEKTIVSRRVEHDIGTWESPYLEDLASKVPTFSPGNLGSSECKWSPEIQWNSNPNLNGTAPQEAVSKLHLPETSFPELPLKDKMSLSTLNWSAKEVPSKKVIGGQANADDTPGVHCSLDGAEAVQMCPLSRDKAFLEMDTTAHPKDTSSSVGTKETELSLVQPVSGHLQGEGASTQSKNHHSELNKFSERPAANRLANPHPKKPKEHNKSSHRGNPASRENIERDGSKKRKGRAQDSVKGDSVKKADWPTTEALAFSPRRRDTHANKQAPKLKGSVMDGQLRKLGLDQGFQKKVEMGQANGELRRKKEILGSKALYPLLTKDPSASLPSSLNRRRAVQGDLCRHIPQDWELARASHGHRIPFIATAVETFKRCQEEIALALGSDPATWGL
ncbi:zinc finger protein [Crotalus adamanteus]|uniref:Zinc finger protein n=1 Tax=Crotalus adamanteus TaxID=8729 RepID=A0AAW1AS48_CROAD